MDKESSTKTAQGVLATTRDLTGQLEALIIKAPELKQTRLILDVIEANGLLAQALHRVASGVPQPLLPIDTTRPLETPTSMRAPIPLTATQVRILNTPIKDLRISEPTLKICNRFALLDISATGPFYKLLPASKLTLGDIAQTYLNAKQRVYGFGDVKVREVGAILKELGIEDLSRETLQAANLRLVKFASRSNILGYSRVYHEGEHINLALAKQLMEVRLDNTVKHCLGQGSAKLKIVDVCTSRKAQPRPISTIGELIQVPARSLEAPFRSIFSGWVPFELINQLWAAGLCIGMKLSDQKLSDLGIARVKLLKGR